MKAYAFCRLVVECVAHLKKAKPRINMASSVVTCLAGSTTSSFWIYSTWNTLDRAFPCPPSSPPPSPSPRTCRADWWQLHCNPAPCHTLQQALAHSMPASIPLPSPHLVHRLIRDLVPLWASKLVPSLHDGTQHEQLLVVPEKGETH